MIVCSTLAGSNSATWLPSQHTSTYRFNVQVVCIIHARLSNLSIMAAQERSGPTTSSTSDGDCGCEGEPANGN